MKHDIDAKVDGLFCSRCRRCGHGSEECPVQFSYGPECEVFAREVLAGERDIDVKAPPLAQAIEDAISDWGCGWSKDRAASDLVSRVRKRADELTAVFEIESVGLLLQAADRIELLEGQLRKEKSD